jgi:hypothetical protein
MMETLPYFFLIVRSTAEFIKVTSVVTSTVEVTPRIYSPPTETEIFSFFDFRGLLFIFRAAKINNRHRQSGAIMRSVSISLTHPRRAYPEAHNSGHDTGEPPE